MLTEDDKAENIKITWKCTVSTENVYNLTKNEKKNRIIASTK